MQRQVVYLICSVVLIKTPQPEVDDLEDLVGSSPTKRASVALAIMLSKMWPKRLTYVV